MTGYAVVGRIERVQVHRAGEPLPEPAADLPPASAADLEELLGQPLDDQVRELVERFREQWAMTTFYLFDVESWR